jgi:hypothetical protein
MAFDYGGMLLPFQIAFLLLVFTTIFAALFLPYIDPTPPLTAPSTTETDPKKKKQSLLTPLKIFIPKRKLVAGKKKWDFNLLDMLGWDCSWSLRMFLSSNRGIVG